MLNGKLITVMVSHGSKRLMFKDATNDEQLWYATALVERTCTDDGVILRTESGAVYDLIDVSTLIPTRVPPLIVMVTSSNFEPIHYKDGFTETVFCTSRDITKDELVEWLKENKYRTNETQEYPYQDYCKITGEGTHWIHKVIHCYTD